MQDGGKQEPQVVYLNTNSMYWYFTVEFSLDDISHFHLTTSQGQIFSRRFAQSDTIGGDGEGRTAG